MPTSKEELIRRGIKPHEIQHNQHRRAEWQDYGGCSLYMVTLCIEGRHPYFGYLKGDIKAQRDAADFPHIVLTPLGRTILNEELPKIHHFYPQIELWKAAIMPDHLHLLLYVADPLPDGKKLGDIIRRFKGGCSRAWWAQEEGKTALKSAGTTATETAGGATVETAGGATAETAEGATAETAGGAAAGYNAGVPVQLSTVKRPSLFEAGYHDRIIKRPGMLENIKRYMSDNPLRALMRRQLPHLLERRLHLRIGSHDYAAFGALFLIKRAEKEQVFYHRRDKETGVPTELTEKYKQNKDRQLAEAREGVVLVSPAISRGESIVINTAIKEGLAVIQLQKEPIGNYWKPERSRFEACARGALLILAPWGLDEEIRNITALKSAGTTAALKSAGTTVALKSAGTTAALKGAGTTAALKGAGTTAVLKGAGTTAAESSDYARFHHLNDLAAEICNTTDAVLLDLTDIC